MDFDPNAPFEVLGGGAAAPAQDSGFDPNAPFDVVAEGPQQQSLGAQAGLGARAALRGLGGVVDMARNAGAAVLNAPAVAYDAVRGNTPGTSEPFNYNAPLAGAADALSNRMGLPTPQTQGERIMGSVVEGAAGGILPGAAAPALVGRVAPGAARAIIGAFADAPVVDAIGGGVGGAAQGAVNEAGGGELAGAGAGLGGGLVGSVVASAIIAAVARRRGVSPGTIDPSMLPPEEVAAAWRDQDVQRAAEANGITSPDDPRVGLLQERLDARRAPAAAEEPLQPPMPPEQVPVVRDGPRPVGPEGEVFSPGTQPEIDAARAAVAPQAVEPPDVIARQAEALVPERVVEPPAPEPVVARPVEVPLVEGAPRADIAPPPPEPPLRPAAAETTQGPPPADLPSAAPVNESAIPLTRSADVLAPEAPAPRLAPEPRPRVIDKDGRDLLAEARERMDRRNKEAAALAAEGKPVRFAAKGGGTALASPDMSNPGGYRLTRFDEAGTPNSHSEYATLREAVDNALRENYRPGRPEEDLTRATPKRLGVLDAKARADALKIMEEMRVAGRGNERFADIKRNAEVFGDPLSKRYVSIYDRQKALHEARRAREGADSPTDAPNPPRGGTRPPAKRNVTDPAPARSSLDGASPADRPRLRADDRTTVLGGDEPRAADLPAAARGEADSAGAGRGVPLYSNALDPSVAKRLVADPVMAGVRSIRQTLSGSTALRSAENGFRLVAHSNRAGMRALERRYENAPAIRNMADALATDPGSTRVVGETFQTAAESRGKSLANRVSNVMGKTIDDAVDGRIRDILTGKARGSAEETVTAKRVRALLDEQFDYLKKAGVDLGYVREKYFPRAYDAEAIIRDPEGFKADAAKVYAKMGLDAEQAAFAADEWIARFQGLGGAASYANTPNGSFTKGRVLPPETDTLLAKWMVPSTRETLASYFQGTSRVAEFTRRFGKGGEKAEAMFREMRQSGVAPQDIKLMRTFYESSTGQMKSAPPTPVQSVANWAQTIGTLAILPRAVLSSLVESMAVGARAGSVWKGLDALATTYAQVLKKGTAAEARQMAEAFGIVSDAMTDMTLASRFEMSGTSKTQQKLLTGMFNVTGLQQLTNMQRVAATKIGQGFVRQMVDEIADGAGTKASASRLVAELGMDEKQAVAVSKWLKGNPTPGDMIGTSPEAQSFRTAITRFVNEAIQNPEAVDKPALASSVGGRAIYGITSFMFAFTRNVLMRSVKQGVNAVTEGGLTAADRLRLGGPMMGLLALASAQYGVSEVRERLFNPQQKKERDAFLDTILSLDRAGMFGTLSPIVNMISSAKYSRDLSSVAVGPYNAFHLGNLQKLTADLLPQPVGPNSRNTNNAEHAAARAAWAGIAAPGIVAALGVLGSAAPLPAKIAAGVGAMALSSPGASRLVADTVAGPKTAQARTAGGQASRGRAGF